MHHSSSRMIAPSIARTMFAIFAVLALAFSAVAIARPALALASPEESVEASAEASPEQSPEHSPEESVEASAEASPEQSPEESVEASPEESPEQSPEESVEASPSESPDRDVTIMVMKHNCANVNTTDEFDAVEARAATNPTTPDAAFGPTVETVLECPTVVLDGDTQTPDAVAGGTSAFDFTVADGSSIQTLSTDGDFMQVGACEPDVAYDATRNGTLDPEVCLDLSHYGFSVEDGAVTVTETEAPAGFSFGALRFTPGSGDDAALISAEAGVIVLDTTADEDGMIMLHVYNFADEAEESPEQSVEASASESPRESELGGNPTAAPGGGNLPDTASEGPASPLVPLFALMVLASIAVFTARGVATARARR